MKILYATSEAVPFCKTGGLADVAGSLPAALAAEGAEVAVVLPLYQRVKEKFGEQLTFECYDYVDLGWRHSYCGLFSLEKDGVTWYFLDNEQYFNRPDLYGYIDDGERFGFFSRAVVRMLDHLKFWPEVIHCNDWQTALVPIYLKDDGVREDKYRSIKTALTIHNIEYQGRYGMEVLGDLFGLDAGWAADGTIMMDGDVNLLKGAILCADAVNAVSPTYANELKMAYFAHRLENIMRQCEYKLSGVLNGIDMKLYDPASDPRITANYSLEDMSGKAADKAHLQKLMGLREEPYVPIVAIVSRLVSHKGLDLICEVLHDMMELPMQLVILGKGDQKYEEFFHWAGQQYQGRMSVRLDYNEELSMAIYAGADLFLMPSKSEPCGLSQMIAMRYGTLPIVRETGGLKDTVQPYEAWRDVGNGFTFANYSSADMLHVIREAVYLYKDYPDAFSRLRKRAMERDFSWARSAKDYLRIYAGITGQVLPVQEREDFHPFDGAAPAAEAETAPAVETAAEAASAVENTEPPRPAEEPAEAVSAPAAEAEKPSPAKKSARKAAAKKPVKKAVKKAAAKKTEPAGKPAVQKEEKSAKKGPAAKRAKKAAE
ncbi:glycogen synthase GlgA [uncultured Dysosmobacter sp.]|uniref:glycogen synthase GlgA n=1 Tax=uncultured Dysosmobacter sp. TaxID=2591384 RepID=UPI002623E3EC|nr:glycogen synthase GlgA [uncultured Dysosmobacter sp.]